MGNYERSVNPEGSDILFGLEDVLGAVSLINETVLSLDNNSDKTGVPRPPKPAKTPKGTKPKPPKRPTGK